MLRMLTVVALGRLDSSPRRSITITSMPARASVSAAVRPAGPAPTTSTCVSSSSAAISLPFLCPATFIGQPVVLADRMSDEVDIVLL